MKLKVTIKSPLSKTVLSETVFYDVLEASAYEKLMKQKYKKFIISTKPCKLPVKKNA